VKVIIAGSRDIIHMDIVEYAIRDTEYEITEVVSGGARGVDRLGEQWARDRAIPITHFPADWDSFGKAAGTMRNQEMIDYVAPDGALIAVWDEKSRGTADIIERANRAYSAGRLHGYRIHRVGDHQWVS